MFDVFNEQTEVLIKDGIANLYWVQGRFVESVVARRGAGSGVSENLRDQRRRRQTALKEETDG